MLMLFEEKLITTNSRMLRFYPFTVCSNAMPHGFNWYKMLCCQAFYNSAGMSYAVYSTSPGSSTTSIRSSAAPPVKQTPMSGKKRGLRLFGYTLKLNSGFMQQYG